MLHQIRKSLKLGLPYPKKEGCREAQKAAKEYQELLLSPGKILAQRPRSLLLKTIHLARHIFIAGGSGNGKSKLLELIVRQIISQKKGGMLIDPHGDTARAIEQYAAVAGIDPSQVVVFRVGTKRCVSFDPYADRPTGLSPLEYQAWLTSTVDRIVRAILRNVSLADLELMKRLRNWLSIILYAAGVDVDGRHLGLSDALILTNPERPEFGPIFERVRSHLPPDYAAELQKLQATQAAYVRDKWMESTINALREVLKGPLVRLVFAQEAQSISLRECLRQQKCVIVDLSESDDLSRDQANVVGGILINMLLSAARRISEIQRVDFYLIVDEAENFIGEDLRMAFAELRKFRLSVCLAIQDLTCLKKGDLDLINKVVSQCGLQITFQQQAPDDIEYLGKAFGYGFLDMTPLLHDVVLPDGYDWEQTISIGMGASANRTASESVTASRTHSETEQRHTGESIQNSVSLALSQSESQGETHGNSWSTTTGRSAEHSDSHTHGESQQDSTGQSSAQMTGSSNGQSSASTASQGASFAPAGALEGRNEGASRVSGQNSGTTKGDSFTNSATHACGVSDSFTEGDSKGLTRSRTKGGNEARTQTETAGLTLGLSKGQGKVAGSSHGRSDGLSLGAMQGASVGEGVTLSINVQKAPLARHKIQTDKPTGQLVVSVQDQLFAIMNKLASLPGRRVLVKCLGMGMPFLMDIHEVLDPYAALGKPPRCLAWQEDDREKFLERVYGAPWYFVPKADDQAARVRRFLGYNIAESSATRGEAAKRSWKSEESPM